MRPEVQRIIQRFEEVRDEMPVSIPSPYRDMLAFMDALELDLSSILGQVAQGPRCPDHTEVPKCEVCGKSVIPSYIPQQQAAHQAPFCETCGFSHYLGYSACRSSRL